MSEALGIDIGGGKTLLARVDVERALIIKRSEIATPPRADSGLAFLAALARAVRAMAPDPVPLGIGICEIVSPAGVVASAHRVDWTGLDAHAAFSRYPLTLESDVRAAALAEARAGAGKPFASFVYVNAGTGLSSAWVNDGVPHAGANGAALVLGTGPLPYGAPPQWVAPESIAGAAAILVAYRARGGEASSTRDVLARAAVGEALAQQIVARAAEQAGAAAGWLANVLDPEAIVVGGGLAVSGACYWQSFLEGLHHTRWTGSPRQLPVLRAGFGADAGVIGAAMGAMRVT